MATLEHVEHSISKRSRGTPTLLTPHRPAKRASLRTSGVEAAVRRLYIDDPPTGSEPSSQHSSAPVQVSWSDREVMYLIEFVL